MRRMKLKFFRLWKQKKTMEAFDSKAGATNFPSNNW